MTKHIFLLSWNLRLELNVTDAAGATLLPLAGPNDVDRLWSAPPPPSTTDASGILASDVRAALAGAALLAKTRKPTLKPSLGATFLNFG